MQIQGQDCSGKREPACSEGGQRAGVKQTKGREAGDEPARWGRGGPDHAPTVS